jgi:hypothetical protein
MLQFVLMNIKSLEGLVTLGFNHSFQDGEPNYCQMNPYHKDK